MINGELRISRPIRWAMVGGGRQGQIGYSHRCAATRDRLFTLLAGAFDVDPTRGREFGVNIGISPDRCYVNYKEMFTAEAHREDGIEAVSIATPNNTHFEICKAALEAGLHVICEKPLCFSTDEAETLQALASNAGRIVGVAYGYAGHQMLQQARAMISDGAIGEVRMVQMQFAHGAHSKLVESGSESLRWRMDPKISGPSYVLGDLATHPFFISGMLLPDLKIKRLMCSRQSFIQSRAPLEDNAYVLMEYEGGAIGSLWASAVNAGSMHGQKIRVIGSEASIEWWDEHPNQLRYEVQGKPAQIMERGTDYLTDDARLDDRIGGGHPEGLFEAWANIYWRFAVAMDAIKCGNTAKLNGFWYPDIQAGVEGVRWVENCVRSAEAGASWIDYC